MDISVSSGGEIKVNVTYKDRVPDLLSAFSETVRRRATRWLRWPSAYERRVWRACKGMPRWARETVRQHLLHERATRIQDRVDRLAEKRRLREARQLAKLVTRQQVKAAPTVDQPAVVPAPERPVAEPRLPSLASAREVLVPVAREPVREVETPAAALSVAEDKPLTTRVGGHRHGAGSALGAPVRGQLTLTERLALEHGIEPAWPNAAGNVQDHGRGR